MAHILITQANGIDVEEMKVPDVKIVPTIAKHKANEANHHEWEI